MKSPRLKCVGVRCLPGFMLVLAACGSDPTGPVVTDITVTAASESVVVGSTVQLTATARDADGNIMTGQQATWSSGTEAVATVSSSGLVTGIMAGTSQITATISGRSGSLSVTVIPPGSLVVTSVNPAQLVEGQPATITGAGFSASAAGNTVTIDGVPAAVSTATSSSLTITVPSGGCMPARSDAIVRVTVGAQSADRVHPVRPAAFTNLPLGQLTLLGNPADFCVQLDESAAASSYVIGVQSVSATATSRTPVRVRGRAAAAGGPMLSNARMSETQSGVMLVDAQSRERIARRQRHSDAELEIRRRERELAPRLFAARRAARTSGGPLTMSALRVPEDAQVGDTVQVRVPNPDDLCAQFTQVTSVVRHRGARAIWVEDITNPAGGFTSGDYATLGGMLDNEIWTTNTTYFGTPTDDDANLRIVVVVTRQVNAREDLLGFVSPTDFFPDDCASSNGGEYYYGKAPDPSGAFGSEYTTEDALADAPSLIAHEFTHIIQIGRRLNTPLATDFQSVWELEGQATFAEEVVGHTFNGNAIGQNYGFATAFNNPPTEPIAWYIGSFSDLAYYYGYSAPNDTPTKIANAPEQCGWLGRVTETEDMGPCLGSRHVYGVSWSFLRWLSDQYGPTYPGGEAALHRRLIEDTNSGFPTIQNVIGRPIDELLAHWAAALYTDDRYAGLDPRLSFTSWNFKGIYDGLVEPARLAPRLRAFSTFTDDVTVIAGSSAYFVVSGASRPATSLSFRSLAGDPLPSAMRVWIVRTQ